MKKKNSITADERDTFRDAVKDVSRLHFDGVLPEPAAPAKPNRSVLLRRANSLAPSSRDAGPSDRLSDQFHPHQVHATEPLAFYRDGVQQTVRKKLRTGRFPIEADLDLHGMTSEVARVNVDQFLHAARDHRARCVLIIHGKGYGSSQDGPVLKNRVNSWLQQHEDVIGFCSAQPKHGGSGAVYVLLRR